MAPRPIVFALANPNPEIDYQLAHATRNDIIVATGRSDYPNQINNVLGFPYIFRGALDCHARAINDEMKIAAVHAISELARRPVPQVVDEAYGAKNMEFGRDYILPKPLDPRLLTTAESGVAARPIEDYAAYEARLKRISDKDRHLEQLLSSLNAY